MKAHLRVDESVSPVERYSVDLKPLRTSFYSLLADYMLQFFIGLCCTSCTFLCSHKASRPYDSMITITSSVCFYDDKEKIGVIGLLP